MEKIHRRNGSNVLIGMKRNRGICRRETNGGEKGDSE